MNRPERIRARPQEIPSQPRRLPRAARKSLRQVFAAPAVIAVISLIGLVSALTGDGLRNIVSWAALGVPVVIAIRAWSRRG
ncbi:hypothetical protein GCM10011529_24550 [Polymorphobacter glacialis]|uniref:Uncharacterized protein n=1 Tax=Sandarakinorhabdus glacialis TaxID=1614636 RepID=A0A916ZXL0_9SPHN|nr:hypothetical protein [Polymorphobacter glacialis]GGE17158.1 hypothetical protein GCM10011529_24550 [Polymorphobacter glacialis]